MSEIELLPCAFCGSAARLQPVGDEQDLFIVECNGCEAMMDIWKPKKIAIAFWNIRVDPERDRLKAEVERLGAENDLHKIANRYALATFRALEQYTFADSDHGLLIAEAVEKLTALCSGGNGDDYAPTDVLPLFRENEDD